MVLVDLAFSNALVMYNCLNPLQTYSSKCVMVLSEDGVMLQVTNANETAVCQACIHKWFLLPGGVPFPAGHEPVKIYFNVEQLVKKYLKKKDPQRADVMTVRVSDDLKVIEVNCVGLEEVLLSDEASGPALPKAEPNRSSLDRILDTFEDSSIDQWLSLDESTSPSTLMMKRFRRLNSTLPTPALTSKQHGIIEKYMRLRLKQEDQEAGSFCMRINEPHNFFNLFRSPSAQFPTHGDNFKTNRSGFVVSDVQENRSTDVCIRMLRSEVHQCLRDVTLLGLKGTFLFDEDGVIHVYGRGETGHECFVGVPHPTTTTAEQRFGNARMYDKSRENDRRARIISGGRAVYGQSESPTAAISSSASCLRMIVEVLSKPETVKPIFCRVPMKLVKIFTRVETASRFIHINLRDQAPLTMMIDLHPAISMYAHIRQSPTDTILRRKIINKIRWLRMKRPHPWLPNPTKQFNNCPPCQGSEDSEDSEKCKRLKRQRLKRQLLTPNQRMIEVVNRCRQGWTG